jgi:hypothetical protein
VFETGSGSATNNGIEALITFGRLGVVADEKLDLSGQTTALLPLLNVESTQLHCIGHCLLSWMSMVAVAFKRRKASSLVSAPLAQRAKISTRGPSETPLGFFCNVT